MRLTFITDRCGLYWRFIGERDPDFRWTGFSAGPWFFGFCSTRHVE